MRAREHAMRYALTLLLCALVASCSGRDVREQIGDLDSPQLEVATFGAGCFWCAEAAFEQLDGVVDVSSGFMGGAELEAPTGDELVAAGHAEVVQVVFDPEVTSYDTLLDWFWRVHDPASFNKQGGDEGPEYRSEIFVRGAQQRAEATASRAALQAAFERPIVTTITDATRYYPARDEHQDYYAKNKDGQYCQTVIAPHLRGAGLED